MENSTNELLKYICENSSMGFDATEELLKIVTDTGIKDRIFAQRNEYEVIYSAAKDMAKNNNFEIKDRSKMQKMSSEFMIKLSTLTGKDNSHIAEMLIQGSTMGIIQIKRSLNKYVNADEPSKQLGEKLLNTEQTNINELLKFL